MSTARFIPIPTGGCTDRVADAVAADVVAADVAAAGLVLATPLGTGAGSPFWIAFIRSRASRCFTRALLCVCAFLNSKSGSGVGRACAITKVGTIAATRTLSRVVTFSLRRQSPPALLLRCGPLRTFLFGRSLCRLFIIASPWSLLSIAIIKYFVWSTLRLLQCGHFNPRVPPCLSGEFRKSHRGIR